MAGDEATRVPVEPLDPRLLEPFLGPARVDELERKAATLREQLGTRRVVNVNSTAVGGGVAEMLQTLLGYARGLGVDADWLVIDGDPEFFEVTKRIHNGLYGGPGDGRPLGDAERAHYERTLARNVDAVLAEVRTGDVVVVHDPQPAGLVPALLEADALVVWRCHVGLDDGNGWSERAWRFVRPYVEHAHGFVFSRRRFAPDWIAQDRLVVIPPSIDPLTPKNSPLADDVVLAALAAAGLVSADGAVKPAGVTRPAHVVRENTAPSPEAPLVVQVSRWDRMKDMAGVLRGFVAGVDRRSGCHLVLAGPAVDGVTDDPEGLQIWDETVALWRGLPKGDRKRVHLAAIPMDDPAENAFVVNALQRHAAVVVQKSIAEGFGLTVAEAMWKSRPVVASAVGGIADQIVDRETGLLLGDPNDLAAFGAAVAYLLETPSEAARLGGSARERVLERYLPDRQLLQYAELLTRLLGHPGS
jgi:trehalose synthase